jgi:hypothetical protein
MVVRGKIHMMPGRRGGRARAERERCPDVATLLETRKITMCNTTIPIAPSAGIKRALWRRGLPFIATVVALVASLTGGASFVYSGIAGEPPAKVRSPKAKKTHATEKARRPAKVDLTAGNFSQLHKLIRPHDNEWRHLKVNWLTDVVAARKKAAKEDKPIIICYTGGAGYNEPLGIC